MNTTSHLSETVRQILLKPAGGVAGLVDELVKVCCAHGLEIDWQVERFRLRCNGGDWESLHDVALRKSVFRAALARIAALCNERSPDSVSAYGGEGELAELVAIAVDRLDGRRSFEVPDGDRAQDVGHGERRAGG